MTTDPSSVWRKCSTCKKAILLGARYYVCSVSTCNGQRTGYVFCGMQCFESHLPGARHRSAGAVEKHAPKTMEMAAVEAGASAAPSESTPKRIIVPTSTGNGPSKSTGPREVLVIASRLKEYIHERSEYNTSAAVMDVLSDYLRIICDRAIDNARAEGRKTVLDRDFEFLKKS